MSIRLIQEGPETPLAKIIIEAYTDLINDLTPMVGFDDWLLYVRSDSVGGGETTVTIHRDIPGGGLDTEGVVIRRTFESSTGRIEHYLFTLGEDLQNTGIAGRVLKATLDVVDRAQWRDTPSIILEANLDVGGYAWLRKGFIPDDMDRVMAILDEAVEFAYPHHKPLERLRTKFAARVEGKGPDELRSFFMSEEMRQYKPLFMGSQWHGTADPMHPATRRAMAGKWLDAVPAARAAPGAASSLSDLSVQWQVLLERFKASEVRTFVPFLTELDSEIRRRLSADQLTSFSRARLEQQLAGMKAALEGTYTEFIASMQGGLHDLATEAGDFEAGVLRSVVGARGGVALPSATQLWSAVETNPLTMVGANGGSLLQPFMEAWGASDAEMVTNAVRVGYALGETNEQIIARVRGSSALNYADGVLAKSRAHAETVVRTAIQHVANSARAEIWAQNSDIVEEYQWVSTLDSRTTPLCRERDGQRFPVGKGPLPPAHPNCRSTTVAVIGGEFGKALEEESTRASVDGPVPAGETYYEWLERQPAAFQDTALGPTRGKLLREGGLSTEQFSKLQLGRNFEPMTLEQMKKLKPKAFRRAGL